MRHHRQDAFDFYVAGVLQGWCSNPAIFPSLEAVRNVRKPGSKTYKELVDSACRMAEEALDVSDLRFDRRKVS